MEIQEGKKVVKNGSKQCNENASCNIQSKKQYTKKGKKKAFPLSINVH